MPLEVGINSYVSIDDADEYFATRIDVAAWAEADLAMKEAALITATHMMDNMNWVGVATTNLLAFPRVCEYFDPKLGKTVYNDGTSVPARIKYAQVELAYHLLNNDGLLDSTGTISKLKVGSIELTGLGATERIPNAVYAFYRPLVARGSLGQGNAWFRAN